MDDGFMRKIISNMRCGICGQQYAPGRISILGRQKGLWFLSVYCEACESHGLVAATVREREAQGMASQITDDEVAGLDSGEVVTMDDFLDMHNFLKDFPGDFLRLFSARLDT